MRLYFHGQRRILLVLVAVVWALTGCRTPVAVEGDLEIEPFENPAASLTQDPSGQWYVLAQRGEMPGDFLTVEFQDETHLFVTGGQGRRSARILPLSRVDARWLQDASEQSAHLEFYDQPADVVVESTIGIWQGGEAQDIRWLGPPPATRSRGIALTSDFDYLKSPSMPDYIRGVVEMSEDGVEHRIDELSSDDGPYLLIPDGPVTRSGPRAATLVDIPFDEESVVGWFFEKVSGYDVSNNAELREMAGRLSVELLLAGQGDEIRVGFAGDGAAPRRPGLERPVALAESGFVIDAQASQVQLKDGLRGIDDLYKNHPLSAAFRFAQARDAWRVDDGAFATRLRHQDLVAAGGYLQWMGAAALAGQDGIGPDLAIYAARGFAYEQDWESVEGYASRAVEQFADWPLQQGALGMARARLLLSEAHRARGAEELAIDELARAADDFLRAEDPYRSTLTNRRRYLRQGGGDFEAAAQQFEEIGADYEASRTLLLAAATDIGHGRFEDARRRLDVWTDKWAERASKRLLLFSWALDDRLAWMVGDAVDAEGLVERGRESVNLRAWEAVVTSALTQHAWRALYDEMDIGRLGELLTEGTLRSDSSLFAHETDSTLGVVCSDVVFSADGAFDKGIFSRDCHERIESFLTTPAGVESILDGGYRFIQRGELKAAEDLEAVVFAAVEEHDDPLWAESRARGYLYRAALAGELRFRDSPGGDDDAEDVIFNSIQEAFEILAAHLEPREAPAILRELAEEFDARGFDRITLALYEASRQTARDTNRSSDEFESALALADARYRAGAWTDLAEMDNVASPLHAARIDLYRGHAEILRENFGNGRRYIERGLTQADDFGDIQRGRVYHLAGQMALERDDAQALREFVEQGLAILSSLPDGIADGEQSRILETLVRTQYVHLLLMEGQRDEAFAQSEKAQSLASELSPRSGAEVHHQVFRAALRTADGPRRYSELIAGFDELNRSLPENVAIRLRRDMIHYLAQVSLHDGDVRRALNRSRSVIGEGLGLSLKRQQHHCGIGAVRLFADEQHLAKFHLNRCVADDPETVSAAHAELLMSLADPEASVSYRVGLAEHLRNQLPDVAKGDRARIEWLIALTQPSQDEDEAQRARLQERLNAEPGDDQEESNRELLEATVEFVEYLLDTAQYDEADQILHSDSSIFFESGINAEAQWMELRTLSRLRQLRPFAAFETVTRLLDEPDELDDEHRARGYYYRAMANLQVDRIFPALRDIERAREFADSDSEIGQKLEELESTAEAIRFGP